MISRGFLRKNTERYFGGHMWKALSARIWNWCFIYIIFGNVDQFYSDETHVGKLLRRPVI